MDLYILGLFVLNYLERLRLLVKNVGTIRIFLYYGILEVR